MDTDFRDNRVILESQVDLIMMPEGAIHFEELCRELYAKKKIKHMKFRDRLIGRFECSI